MLPSVASRALHAAEVAVAEPQREALAVLAYPTQDSRLLEGVFRAEFTALLHHGDTITPRGPRAGDVVNREWQSAIDTGEIEVLRASLAAGADVDVRDRYGQTGLMRASMRGHLEVARLLIARGANLDAAAKHGLTALMLALVNLHEDVALALVEAGADLTARGSGAPGFAEHSALDLARSRRLERLIAAIEERERTSG